MAIFARALAFVCVAALFTQSAMGSTTTVSDEVANSWYGCPQPSGSTLTIFGVRNRALFALHAEDTSTGDWEINTLLTLPRSFGSSPDGLAFMNSTNSALFSMLQGNGKGRLYAVDVVGRTSRVVGTLSAHPWGATFYNNQYWYILDSGEVRRATLNPITMTIASDAKVFTVPTVILPSRRKAYLKDGDIDFDKAGKNLYITGSVTGPTGAQLSRRLSVYNVAANSYTILREETGRSNKADAFGANTALGQSFILGDFNSMMTQDDDGDWFRVTSNTPSTTPFATTGVIATDAAAFRTCGLYVIPTTTTTRTTRSTTSTTTRTTTSTSTTTTTTTTTTETGSGENLERERRDVSMVLELEAEADKVEVVATTTKAKKTTIPPLLNSVDEDATVPTVAVVTTDTMRPTKVTATARTTAEKRTRMATETVVTGAADVKVTRRPAQAPITA